MYRSFKSNDIIARFGGIECIDQHMEAIRGNRELKWFHGNFSIRRNLKQVFRRSNSGDIQCINDSDESSDPIE